MKLSSILLMSLVLASCTADKIYTVKEIKAEPDGRSCYHLVDDQGEKMLLIQKRSEALVPGAKIRFVEEF